MGRWRERNPDLPIEATEYDDDALASALRVGSVDIAFLRLPIDRDSLSVIPLYEELAVAVVSTENELSLLDEVPLADLATETLLDVHACGGPKLAMEVVASGTGVAVLPMAVARHYNRRDVVARVIPDAPATTIAVTWIADNTTDDIEEFIGIVRGRTARSSRQPSAQPEGTEKKKKAPRKTADKQANKQTGRQARKPTGTKGAQAVKKARGRRR